MRTMCRLMIAGSAAALAACGTHASVRSEAVAADRAQAASTGRVYNSKADYQRQTSQGRAAASARRGAATGPAPLTPVATDIQHSKLDSILAPMEPAPTIVAASEPARAPTAGGGWVSVGPGDTVYAIARRTGASPQAIIAENRLRPPYGLKIGDTLRVPDPERKIANTITEPTPRPASAPIRTVVASDRMHKVRRGETLYAISRSSGVSVEKIAQANRLRAPYTLQIGDQILVPGARADSRALAAAPIPRETRPAQDVGDIARTVSYSRPENPSTSLFEWPVKGAIIGGYGAGAMGRRNDGINIAAPVGTPVRAAADGEVVYRGAELDGYGNLLLVKHVNGFVTAYAHNDAMLVKKGDLVRQGQVIAKVGQSGAAGEPQLHFEIRQNLKSVDPQGFLPR